MRKTYYLFPSSVKYKNVSVFFFPFFAGSPPSENPAHLQPPPKEKNTVPPIVNRQKNSPKKDTPGQESSVNMEHLAPNLTFWNKYKPGNLWPWSADEINRLEQIGRFVRVWEECLKVHPHPGKILTKYLEDLKKMEATVETSKRVINAFRNLRYRDFAEIQNDLVSQGLIFSTSLGSEQFNYLNDAFEEVNSFACGGYHENGEICR